MCGIVGYIGKQKAAPILLEGLKRLEYRGYDSAGISTMEGDGIRLLKKEGRVEGLSVEVGDGMFQGCVGISHTRWATHGKVSRENAHPHLSADHRFSLVHNGVIENYGTIKRFLLGRGYTFSSETDSEVLVNLIAYHYDKEPEDPASNRFLESVRKALMHV